MPTELPNTPPSPEQRLRGRVTDAILSRAADIRTKSGGVIKKVDAVKAWRLAPLFVEEARRTRPDAPMHFMAYLLATTTQESRNDPEALNPNYTDGSDPRRNDYGIGQISGVNLLAAGHDPARAFDPAWAIPQVARRIVANLKWARTTFPKDDPYYVAAMAYNKGQRGTRSILTNTPLEGETWLQFQKRKLLGRAHARSVMGLYGHFTAIFVEKGGE